ncbi:MAG TPA: Flp family type IVb pilin [Methanosarcina sp.]|nr:Flp family type IVb pilin [Methanosarcina sp.]
MLFSLKEKGQGLVEYALILVFIAILVIVAVGLLGSTVNTIFGTINSGL